jgi:ATP-dependent helicase/nuclease subunit A
LDYERHEAPSLQGFLAWIREARAEVKRDMEIKRDEVRVMTVHGAKGLEAPIVILADTITPPAGPRPPRLLTLADGPLIWVGRKADDVPPVQAARQVAVRDAEDEYRRLLYVAMTRAADRLIVCGAEGVRGRPSGCWYDLVRGPLEGLLIEEQDNGETILCFRKSAIERAPRQPTAEQESRPERPALPTWLRELAPAQPRLPVPLSPSLAFDEEIVRSAPAGGSAMDRQKALARGRLVHRLLQSLPDIPPERRRDAAERYLAKAGGDFSAADQEEIVCQVLAILEDASFAPLFAAGSRAELPIVGHIPSAGNEPIAVSGQVDRLVVSNDGVLIADYKSDRAVPTDLSAVGNYVAQLGLYRAVLSRLYPGKRVRAALVFTSGPRLIELPEAAMDAAVAKVLTEACNAPVKVP